MSSPTPLIAAVVVPMVLAAWTWAPGPTYNRLMLECNRTAMPVVSLHEPQIMQGRWYVSHYTVNQGVSWTYNRIIYDFKRTTPLARDVFWLENRMFWSIYITRTWPSGWYCHRQNSLEQIVGNKSSGNYWFSHNTSSDSFNIYYFDSYLLATDSNSTAVLYKEQIYNASLKMTASEIVVLVKDPSIAPDAEVVDAALNGFCPGKFLNLSSDYYVQVSYDSNLTCF